RQRGRRPPGPRHQGGQDSASALHKTEKGRDKRLGRTMERRTVGQRSAQTRGAATLRRGRSVPGGTTRRVVIAPSVDLTHASSCCRHSALHRPVSFVLIPTPSVTSFSFAVSLSTWSLWQEALPSTTLPALTAFLVLLASLWISSGERLPRWRRISCCSGVRASERFGFPSPPRLKPWALPEAHSWISFEIRTLHQS